MNKLLRRLKTRLTKEDMMYIISETDENLFDMKTRMMNSGVLPDDGDYLDMMQLAYDLLKTRADCYERAYNELLEKTSQGRKKRQNAK